MTKTIGSPSNGTSLVERVDDVDAGVSCYIAEKSGYDPSISCVKDSVGLGTPLASGTQKIGEATKVAISVDRIADAEKGNLCYMAQKSGYSPAIACIKEQPQKIDVGKNKEITSPNLKVPQPK